MQQNLSIKVALAAIDKMTQPLNAARKASQGLASAVKSTQGQIKALQSQAKKFDSASAAVKNTADAIKTAQEQAKKMRDEFGDATRRTEEQKAALQALDKQIAQLNIRSVKENKTLEATRQGLEKLGIVTKGNINAQLIRQTRELNEQLSREEAQLKRTTSAQASYDRAKKLQGKMASAGFKAGAAGGAMLWGSMRAMRPGMDFDQAFSQTLAVAQLSRNSQEGQALREQAKMLSRTTHFSALQATQGQSQLISGGMSAANARQALPGMMNLALAAHSDLGAAASAGSNVLDHFQLQASQMGHVSDVLVGTFTRSKTSLESLDETLEYVGTVANNAGVSLETTAAAAAMLAKNGLKGSIAGTGLKETLTGLYAPSTEGSKALKALHIGTTTATGAIRPLADVLGDLWKKTRKFDQGSQLDIFKSLFGQQGMQAGQVLARASAEGNLQAFNDYLVKIKGVAASTSRTMTDNFDGDMQMLHSAWDGLWTQMEEGVDSPLRKIVQWITQMLQNVTTWAQAHPALTKAIMGTVLAMGALLLVGGAIITTLAGLLGPLAALKLSVSLLAGGEGFGMLGEVASAVFGPLMAMIGGLTWPVLALIAVFAVAAVAIIRYWEPIKAFFTGMWAGIMDAAAPFIESVKREWRDIGALFSWLWGKLTDFLSPVHESKDTLDKCASAGHKFGEVLGSAINKVLTPIKWLNKEFDKLLRKAGIVPDIPDALQDKIDALKGDMAGIKAAGDTVPQSSQPGSATSHPGVSGPEFGSMHWTPPGKSGSGAGSSASSNVNRLGDIVFRSLPAWVPLSAGFAQPRIVAGSGASGSRLTAPAPKSAPAIGTNVAGDINLHIHIEGADHLNHQQLATEVKHQVMGELNRLNRQKLSSLKDRD